MSPRSLLALVPSLLAAALPLRAQSCLELPQLLPVVEPGSAIACADFDGDGLADLATTHASSSGKLCILLHQPGGAFQPYATYLVAGMPVGITSADLSGDNLPDLAIALSNGGVAVLLNQGAGAFGTATPYPLPSGTQIVVAGDFDGDGDRDLLAAGSSGGCARLVNQGGGSFAAPVPLVPGAFALALAAADLDGDGDLDLAWTSGAPLELHVCFNLGGWNFSSPVDYPTLGAGLGLQAADFDGDGDLDLAVLGSASAPAPCKLQVFRNLGAGVFSALPARDLGTDVERLVRADLDRDGDLDLAFTRWPNVLDVALNDGAAGFAAPEEFTLAGTIAALASGDLDGDGDADLALPNLSLASVAVLSNCTADWTAFCAGDGTGPACPCQNAGLPGRGCDNSVASGGAGLAASGRASLAQDTLLLHASGELDHAASIVLQGDALLAGVAFGDGLRCVGGHLKRLYLASATGGSVTVPGAGATSVSARSAAVGDSIPAGATRHYQVYYRDPSSGFCPAPQGNTWNVSSAVSVHWTP